MFSLHKDEEIILERRQHWLPIAAEGVFLLLVGIAPLLSLLILDAMPPLLRTLIQTYTIPVIFFALAWLEVMWLIFAVSWTNYYLDVIILTNKRVIDIEQIGLFARDIAELRYENIEDLRVEVIGLLPSLLHYGNINIQTAGEHREFIIRNIPDPHGVIDMISSQYDIVMGKGGMR